MPLILIGEFTIHNKFSIYSVPLFVSCRGGLGRYFKLDAMNYV